MSSVVLPGPRPSVAHFVRRHARAAVLLAAAALIGVAAWRTAVPLALGGPASYVVTDGTSMLPHFRADGLVVTEAASTYSVGQVVAYRNHDLRAVVMHRIVALDGDRYVFKGDNNDFRDQYHATRNDLVGRESLYWPGAGRYLRILRNPLTFGMVVAVVTALSLGATRRSRRRRRHNAW